MSTSVEASPPIELTAPKQAWKLGTVAIEDFLAMPETKPASEFMRGCIYQKPMPQLQHSLLQAEITTAINQRAKPARLAMAFPELRCRFDEFVIVPDIVVSKWQNIPVQPDGKVANQVNLAPDWLIEILSPAQSPTQLMLKIMTAISLGSALGWLVSPEQEAVMVFQGDRLPEIKTKGDRIPVLPDLDWQISAAELFGLLRLQ